jgi:membrane protease YdiL (CAAX protease family)
MIPRLDQTGESGTRALRLGERVDAVLTDGFRYVGLALLAALWSFGAAIGLLFPSVPALPACVIVGVLFCVVHLRTPKQRERVWMRPIPLPAWAVAAVAVTFAAFKLSFDTLLTALLPDGGRNFVADWLRGGHGWSAVIAALVLVGPFAEEVGFRGWIQADLHRRFSPATAVVAGAVVFAVFHGSLRSLPSLLMGGLVLGYAFYATRSLWMSVLLHVASNTVAALMESNLPFGVRAAAILLLPAAAVLAWLALRFRPRGEPRASAVASLDPPVPG